MDYQKYIYWQDGDMWLGYLERYPDYWTQGETQEELREKGRSHQPCLLARWVPTRDSRPSLLYGEPSSLTGGGTVGRPRCISLKAKRLNAEAFLPIFQIQETN